MHQTSMAAVYVYCVHLSLKSDRPHIALIVCVNLCERFLSNIYNFYLCDFLHVILLHNEYLMHSSDSRMFIFFLNSHIYAKLLSKCIWASYN